MNNTNKNPPSCESGFLFGAGDRGRTGTSITAHGILSPGRLPVPPHRQIIIIIYAQERLYHIFFDLSNFLLKFFIKRFKLIDLN